MSRFKRNFNDQKINKLKKEDLFKEKLINDIKKGNVFPAVRDGNIGFYSNGSRLFKYECNKFLTHKKYISLLISKNNYLSEEDIKTAEIRDNFLDCYEDIKENSKNYASVESEGVAYLYSDYSYVNSNEGVVVLDLEVNFKNKNDNSKRKNDQIDILLYSLADRSLKFVEAKEFSNQELWSKENTKPQVVNQINRYNRQINNSSEEILKEYETYIKKVNKLFNIDLPLPKRVRSECGLYIFGFGSDQKEGRFKRLIKEDNSLEGIKNYARGNPSEIDSKTLWNKVIS